MPELPDIEAYLAALRDRVEGRRLLAVRIAHPFLVRSFDPPLEAVVGRTVLGLERLGKRVVFCLDDDLFVVLHLMIAGRLHWSESGAPVPKGRGLAALDFESGTLILTEAGKKRRASLHVARGREGLADLAPGGRELVGLSPAGDVEAIGLEEFRTALAAENHTLKRALTDPRIFSGIGNAYSDEILHRARLSPFKQTRSLTGEEVERLHGAALAVLTEWTLRLVAAARAAFPEKVTAFREGMAVHGRFDQPCPVCGTAVQRIVYAENEADYCPRCQTEGRLLADRSLSRLLKDDWPRTVEELERRRSVPRRSGKESA